MSQLHIWVYRDLENRRVGEPDNGPLAWEAHRERERVLEEILADPGCSGTLSEEAIDREQTHEFVEMFVAIGTSPTVQALLLPAAAYIGKILTKQVDKMVGDAVAGLFEKLTAQFKKKRIGDFWIECPDGTRIAVGPDGYVRLTLRDGKLVSFDVDHVPSDPDA